MFEGSTLHQEERNDTDSLHSHISSQLASSPSSSSLAPLSRTVSKKSKGSDLDLTTTPSLSRTQSQIRQISSGILNIIAGSRSHRGSGNYTASPRPASAHSSRSPSISGPSTQELSPANVVHAMHNSLPGTIPSGVGMPLNLAAKSSHVHAGAIKLKQ